MSANLRLTSRCTWKEGKRPHTPPYGIALAAEACPCPAEAAPVLPEGISAHPAWPPPPPHSPPPTRPDLCPCCLAEIQVMMGSLVYLRLGLEKSPYCHLLDNSHWAEICETFTRDACSLLGLSVESPLSVRYRQPCGGSPGGRVSGATICGGQSMCHGWYLVLQA